jgi:hypothetical protein
MSDDCMKLYNEALQNIVDIDNQIAGLKEMRKAWEQAADTRRMMMMHEAVRNGLFRLEKDSDNDSL